jgi:hypothetical protein
MSAQAFSYALFGPGGLFQQLASSEAERRTIAGSALFQRANARLTELQRAEAAELNRLAQRRHTERSLAETQEANGTSVPPVEKKLGAEAG